MNWRSRGYTQHDMAGQQGQGRVSKPRCWEPCRRGRSRALRAHSLADLRQGGGGFRLVCASSSRARRTAAASLLPSGHTRTDGNPLFNPWRRPQVHARGLPESGGRRSPPDSARRRAERTCPSRRPARPGMRGHPQGVRQGPPTAITMRSSWYPSSRLPRTSRVRFSFA